MKTEKTSTYKALKLDNSEIIVDFADPKRILSIFVRGGLFQRNTKNDMQELSTLLLVVLPFVIPKYEEQLVSLRERFPSNSIIQFMNRKKDLIENLTPLQLLDHSPMRPNEDTFNGEDLLSLPAKMVERVFDLWYRNVFASVNHSDLIMFMTGQSSDNVIFEAMSKSMTITDWFGSILTRNIKSEDSIKAKLLVSIFELGTQAYKAKNLLLLKNIHNVLSHSKIMKSYSGIAENLRGNIFHVVEGKWNDLLSFSQNYKVSRRLCEANDHILPLFEHLLCINSIREIETFSDDGKIDISKVALVYNYLLYFYKWNFHFISKLSKNVSEYPEEISGADLNNFFEYSAVIDGFGDEYVDNWSEIIYDISVDE